MADIRINALATTAASTASDDFVAVDGSANGTRKLNAYSPTFGGNLTVSGTTGTIGSNSGFTWDLGSGNNFIALSTGRPTITAAVASGNNAGATLSLLARGGGSRRTWNLETDTTEAGDCVLRQSTTEAGSTFTNALYFSAARNATLSGNLTVSGTGTSTFTGDVSVTRSTGNPTFNLTNGASGGFPLVQFIDQRVGGNNWNIENGRVAGQLGFYSSGGGGTVAAITAGGNLLLGTTTDSGNGKLQLATHTTSAGGIGFGTTTSLYRYSITTLGLQQNSGSYKPLYFYADVTNCGVFDTPAAEPNYSGIYFNSTANSATIATKGTVALTLDAYQNATFAGKTYTAAGAAATPAISFSGDTDTGFYNAGGNQMALACGGGQIWNTTVNGLSMASGKDIYLGNAYVAGAPTATGYVTIKDSAGNTYKVLVGT